MNGQFFWYDVVTTDVKAATGFYADVVGWGTQDVSVGDRSYTAFTLDGAGVAGLMPMPAEMAGHGAPPVWLGYIAVDDVDAAAAALTDAGGTVLRPPETIPDIIRFAVVADPQGAAFYIAKAQSPNALPDRPFGTPGTIGWHELMADNWEKAFAFYERMFGWTKAESHDMGPMGVYQLFGKGGEPFGGMMTKPPMIPRPYWGFYFNVSAIDAAAALVTANKGIIRNGPMQVPGGQWVIQCADPQGASFGLVAPGR